LARLVVVSNRVPTPDLPRGARAGGLEVALKSALKANPGVWFGWSGQVAPEASDVKTETSVHDNVTYVVTDLVEEDFREFYYGFANRVLWPILHYRLDLAEYTRRDLGGYMRVNQHFANELHKILRPDDIIWVHDYHLIPLAKALRDRGHDNRIGFFLHIPFPSPEILTALPNHDRLIPTLCQYDLAGFQTEDDVTNFFRYLTKELGLRARDGRVTIGSHTLQVDAFPVGVETDAFARLARRAIRSDFVQEVVGSLSGRAMIIGVDRLDYSKGITHRMDAFERFLIANPDWRNKVTYLQITPKSRTDIPEYTEMERVVGETAGRINGAFGEASWTPIRYVNRAHSRSALAGLFRAARAALVTPLRDGMNLVAKEYVAAQDPDDPGVLILSRFAGAAHECERALLVNPYDPEGVGAAIANALAMPLGERRERYRVMYAVLAKNDIHHWASRFLAALREQPAQPHWLGSVSAMMRR
jgi:trehalose 6-phosphate synthase